jgi:hypothetical protein
LGYLDARTKAKISNDEVARRCLATDYHCADYEEDDGEERGERDHDAFVESVRAAGGKAVFGAKV